MRVSGDVLRMVKEETKAALTNEQITRTRVEAIEAVFRRGLWGRLKWLLRGK